jgi:hypothetical protein
LWFAIVKKSGWLRAALITLMRFVSPECIGMMVVPALSMLSKRKKKSYIGLNFFKK